MTSRISRLSLVGAVVALVVSSAAAAHATTLVPLGEPVANGIDVYMSAPTVQGTFVDSAVTETFDSGCNSTWAVGEETLESNCGSMGADNWGGASSITGDPVVGGTVSDYAAAFYGSYVQVDLPAPAKYIGFWWAAGDDGNKITFYSNGVEVASYTTAAVMDILNGGEGTVDAVDGTTYDTADYMFNPALNDNPGYPWVYLNIVAKGDFTFDSFKMEETEDVGNFEFDNVAVGTVAVTPDDSLVYASSYGDAPEDELASTGFDFGVGLGIAVAILGSGVALIARRRIA